MTGPQVQAFFANATSPVLNWAATGANSGGVTTPAWSLSVSGDTFNADWVFSFTNPTALGPLRG